jgi:hypothetical protein
VGASSGVFFPPGLAANTIRGALGTIFRKLACSPDCPGARTCTERERCPYARLFEPVALWTGPSGLRDHPRPFVIRAVDLDGATVAAGCTFAFDLHLFDLDQRALPHFISSFQQLAEHGLGAGRGLALLESVDQMDQMRLVRKQLYRDGRLEPPGPPVIVPLDAGKQCRRLTVRFTTPTELKSGGDLVDRPEFEVLFARARDRVSSLRSLYGGGPVNADFRALGLLARQVRMTRCDLRRENPVRRSTKTGQRHSIGGFLGEADYEGEMDQLLPWIEAAVWTGVGRQTVWGKGTLTLL